MGRKGMIRSRKTLHAAIGLTLAASLIGITACSNDTKDVTLNSDDVLVDESEAVVETESSEVSPDNSAATDVTINEDRENNWETDDKVAVNESNNDLDKTSAEGL